MTKLYLTTNKIKAASLRNSVCVPTDFGECCFCTFNNLIDQNEHFALLFHLEKINVAPLVRIHSECITGDLFHSKRCDCGDQLQESLRRLNKEGGVLLYLRQEGRGIGLYNKLDAYSLQLQGLDTYEANHHLNFSDDHRSYDVAAQMLTALGINRIRIITNNPKKIEELTVNGIEVLERIGTECYLKPENKAYITAKKQKTGHYLEYTSGAII